MRNNVFKVLTRLIPAVLLLAVFFIAGWAFAVSGAASAPIPETPPPTVEPTPEPTPTPTPVPTATPEPTPTPTPEPEYDYVTGLGEPLYDYACGVAVPESEAVEDDFFSDTVFLGDSRTQGFMMYSGLRGSSVLAGRSINVVNIYSEPVISAGNDTYVSIMQALTWKTYSKIYIMLGINEIGFSYEYFYELYSDLVDSVRKLQPDAEIYIESILPVSKAKSENGGLYNNYRIRKFNEQLLQLCEDTGAHYIDTYSSMINEEGNLPDGASSDGVHLGKTYCVTWLDYLKTHTVLPRETGETVETDEPIQTDKPVETDEPIQTDKPVETDEPVKSDKPVEAE